MTRHDDIIDIIRDKKKVEVNDLSETLDVSKVTIRKDLTHLEDRGILHRQHGYAVLNSEDDLNYRLAVNYDVKKRIAKEAAKEIEDDDTIMIESGSTCALLAEIIATERKNVTIITNSSFIASYIRKNEGVNLILLGGEYQKKSQVSIGPITEQVVSHFHVDKLFIGIDGIDKERGFTGQDLRRAQTVRMMAKRAENLIILTDSTKFKNKGTVTTFTFPEVAKVYTDFGIQKNVRAYLKVNEIELSMV